MLLCTVRGCRLPLLPQPGGYACSASHRFDLARSGYLNLLQPQDRRSRLPGDSPPAIAARRRLHARGVTAPVLDALAQITSPQPSDAVLDVGCGEGFFLGTLAARYGFSADGVDISARALDAAARRYPHCRWVVANADRFLPYASASFSLVFSITARMPAAEIRRVLRPGGRLLVAIPAPNDLIQLRGAARDRLPRTLQTFQPAFRLLSQNRLEYSAELDAPTLHDLLLTIYRPRPQNSLQPTRVTFSLDLLLFSPH